MSTSFPTLKAMSKETLIDLSLDEVAGKSPLPPIIVTPCSPSSSRDFSFAFLPCAPKPSFSERLQSYKNSSVPSFRVRSIFCVLLIMFVLFCHLFTHHFAVRHYRLDSLETGEVHVRQSLPSWNGLLFTPTEVEKVLESNSHSESLMFDHGIDYGLS
jgi:hypothetical protein